MSSQQPFDQGRLPAGPSLDDPLAARLASLAPAPAGIDPALTFYRAGFAAAGARRESRRAWLRVVAACLLATVTAGPAGYLIGRDRAAASAKLHLAREDAPRTAPGPTDFTDPRHDDGPRRDKAAAGERPATAAVAVAEAQPPEAASVDARLVEDPSRELATTQDAESRSSWLATWLARQLLGDSFTAATRRPRDEWNAAAGIHDPRTLEMLVRFDTPPPPPESAGRPATDHGLAQPQTSTPPPTRMQLLDELLN